MSRDQYAVIIVNSTSHALRVEKLLILEKITCKLIPVPRQISSDCGVCVRVFRDDVEAVQRAIGGSGVEIRGIHEI
jgi:hypothetical protein